MTNLKKKPEYKETNGIPICPHCQKPTERTGGVGETTLMYFPPCYDKTGKNINPDRNMTTYKWDCEECGREYRTRGNYVDGFDYV